MEEETFRADYNVIFRCSVCNEDKDSLEKLEAHLWNCHLREFPYRCAKCGYPALNSKALCIHFEEVHDRSEPILFKRSIVNELRLREMISRSILFPMEQIFDGMDVPTNGDESIEQIPILDQEQIQQIVSQEEENQIAVETPFETIAVNEFNNGVVQEQIVNEEMRQQEPENVITVEATEDGAAVFLAHASYEIYDGESFVQYDDVKQNFQYVDEDGNPLDNEELVAEEDSFQENLLPQSSHFVPEEHVDGVIKKVAGKPRRRATIHQCQECGKVLKYPSKIAEHLRSHTGEKPHICKECGAAFTQKGALRCHERLHTGEKPYPCTWECGRSFVSASARQMHEKMHTGEKNFICPECGHLFTKKFHMQRHMASLHPKPDSDTITGLDAAGADASVLLEAVTSVIEDVRRSKMKKSKRIVPSSTSVPVHPVFQ